MKKLVLAAVVASLSAPVMASDIMATPWPWTTTARVTSVTRSMQLTRMVVVGGLTYADPVNHVPNGLVVNPTLTINPSSEVTLNGVKVTLNGLLNLSGATCVIQGGSTNLNDSRTFVTTAMLQNNTHTVIKATCTK